MSTLKPFGEILDVRTEVLEGQGLLDMIDLAHVSGEEKRGLGAMAPGQDELQNPERFFALTYPTVDVHETLRAISKRVSNPEDVPGTILLSGRYGAGKSHVMLAAHHALTAPDVAKRWWSDWELGELDIPDNAVVITRSFIHRTTENLWDVFFSGVGRLDLIEDLKNYPDGATIQDALGDQPAFLILDELERWYDAVDAHTKSLNRNFLQALSEVAMRDGRLTIITSVLGETQEPAETIRRIKPMELLFRSSEDRQKVILYRLFENNHSHDTNASKKVVYEYASAYSKAGLEGVDEYQARFQESYPFSPEFLDILIKKVPNLGGFQNTRGTLRFLSKIVRETYNKRPVITTQNIPIENDDVATTLKNLDTTGGEIVRRALGDNYETVPNDLKHKHQLFSAILFYSIADPTHPGATEAQLLLSTLDPGENPNQIKDSLLQIRQLAYNLHQDGDRYLFKTQENPRARINAVSRSPQVTDSACRTLLLDALQDRWSAEKQTVIFNDDEEKARRDLKDLGRNRPKYLISTRSLSPQRALKLQNLEEKRNTVLIIEPVVRSNRQDASYNLLADDELMDRARRVEACSRLLEASPSKDSAAVYRDVRQHEKSKIQTLITEKYGYYLRWNRAGGSSADVDHTWFELEKLPEFSASRFMEYFQRDLSSIHEITARVLVLWPDYEHRRASQLIDYFDSTPGEPVPYDADMVPGVLRKLAIDGKLGLQDDDGRTYSKDANTLSNDALSRCTLVDPPTSIPELPPDPEEELPIHKAVSALFDTAKKAVVLAWTYPDISDEDATYRSLVQRYTSSKGWEKGIVHSVDLDSTLGANRFIGADASFLDAEHLEPGIWYHYYVFLVEDRPGHSPRAILSRHIDVRIPPEESQVGPDTLVIPPQQNLSKLLVEVEKMVMSHKNMSASDRLRKLEFEIRHIVNHPSFDSLGASMPVGDGEIEVSGQASVVLRGDYSRQEAMKCVQKLPKVEGAVYAATLFIARDEV